MERARTAIRASLSPRVISFGRPHHSLSLKCVTKTVTRTRIAVRTASSNAATVRVLTALVHLEMAGPSSANGSSSGRRSGALSSAVAGDGDVSVAA